MSKNYFLLALLFFYLHSGYSQNTAIPDSNFEQALIDLGLDTDGLNNSVITANISGIASLNVSSKNISDLTGIEDFIALTDLLCASNQLTSLDVSHNTDLTFLGCANNNITQLDLSQNIALKIITCYSNKLTSLEVSQNTALTDLYCYSNQITSLDLSQNTALTALDCKTNYLDMINVENGNNSIIIYFNSRFNGNVCIQVDDATAANAYEAPYNNGAWYFDFNQPGSIWPFSDDCSALNVDDKLLAQGLSFYPNPVRDILTIHSKVPLTKVELYSILGENVKVIHSGFNAIPMGNLANGLYIVRVQSNNGVVTKKLIKH